jgi:hypothetical protein
MGMLPHHRTLSIAAHFGLIILRFPHRRLKSFFNVLQLLRARG